MTYTTAEAARLGYQKELDRRAIVDKFGLAAVKVNQNLFCQTCRLTYPRLPKGVCLYGLLPLTIESAKCPYYLPQDLPLKKGSLRLKRNG